MKGIASILLILLVSSPLVLIEASICSTTSGATEYNPFLVWLDTKTSGTVITASAPATGSICFSDWSSPQTCCDTTKLKAIYDGIVTASKNGYTSFIATVNMVFEKRGFFEKAISNTTDTEAQFTTSITDYSTRLGGLGMNATQAKDKLVAFAPKIKDQVDAFKTSAADCFNTTNAYIGQVFCEGCKSLQGSDTSKFGTGPTVKYIAASANGLVEKCITVWKLISDVQIAVHLMGALAEVRTTGVSKPAKTAATMFFIDGSKKAQDVSAAFTACPTGKIVVGTCTQTDLDTIFAAFFSFTQPPISTVLTDADVTLVEKGVASTRILQATDATSGTVVVDIGGINLAASASLTSNETLDTSSISTSTTTTSSVSQNIAISAVVALLSILALF